MDITSLMYDTFLCRLCGEENQNGTNLFPTEENETDLSQLVNRYLPLKVENNRKLPSKICPGCNIQLETTKLFMDLIIEGQNKLRELYKVQQDKLTRQEKQRMQLEKALKAVNPTSSVDSYSIETDESGENFFIKIVTQGPLFPSEHELSLRVEGLERPRRRRGRPPKLPQPPEPVPVEEESSVTQNESDNKEDSNLDKDGKRRRRVKAPNRYMGALQGKELDMVFKQEGVIDEESLSEDEIGDGLDDDEDSTKKSGIEEIIGRMVDENGDQLGQPVVVNKNFNKPKIRNKIGTIQSKKRRKYQCDICGREFLHYGRYVLHKKMHDVEYTCSDKECNFKTDQKVLLEQHQQDTGHSGRTASEKVEEIGTLQLPEIQTTDSPPLIETDSNAKKEKCDKCNKEFTCKQNYEVHYKAVHEGERPFACSHCDKRFSHAKTLRLHLLSHNKKNDENCAIYRCSACPKTFRHPSSLQYHRDSEHTNGRKFVCNKCDKPFKHRQLLQRHQIVHTEERPHRCFQCSSAFKTRANLIHHSRTVHAGQRSHWCGQCGKAFAHKTALKLHQRWHSGVRPFQCEFCSKSFSQKGNLAEHRRIHTGEKPYQCDHCGRAFTTSSQFRLHCKRHLGERPHKCDYCHKSFVNKESLKCHIRRHFDERPFRCQYCSKSFTEGWALKKHERLHTGERPYHCEQCPKTFADSSNLTKHKRTHNNAKNNKQVVFVTYENKEQEESVNLEKSTVVHYLNSDDSIIQTTEIINVNDELPTMELQQLIDEDGNPITFTTEDGQQVKVISSTENGQEIIQGLLPDGTLIPINLTPLSERVKNEQLNETDNKLELEGELLESNIQFLDENDTKNNIQFISEDNQMCLVAYNIEDSINPQYLTMS